MTPHHTEQGTTAVDRWGLRASVRDGHVEVLVCDRCERPLQLPPPDGDGRPAHSAPYCWADNAAPPLFGKKWLTIAAFDNVSVSDLSEPTTEKADRG